MPKVKVAYDNMPNGAKVEVPYLGVFENGSTTEVDEATWQRFVENAPSGEQYKDKDTLEVGTASAEQATEQHQQLRKAAAAEQKAQDTNDEPEDKPLSDYNKDELAEMAKNANVEGYADMKKSELVDALSQEGQ